MGYGPYRNQYKTEFAKELWNQAVDIMDARRNEISLARLSVCESRKRNKQSETCDQSGKISGTEWYCDLG